MKAAILGTGAMGCLFGAGISKNNEVIMLCHRKEQADEINKYGITVYEPDKSCNHYKDSISAYVSGQYTETVDLLIVLTKTMATDDAMMLNRHIISEKTLVLTLQNGGGNAAKLEKYCSKEQIFIGTTKHNCVNLGNGSVRHSGSGITYIGANVDEVSAEPIVHTLSLAGFEVEESDNIRHLVWEKLFVNLSINSFTAIARAPIGACISNGNSWYFMEKLICEAVDVAKASGQNFSYYDILTMVHKTCERVSTGFSSMSQDVMNARKTEIDCINGYVVEQAKLYNISTPYNELIQNLVHAVENTYQYQEMPVCRYAAGDVIMKEGQDNSELYKIIEGKCCAYLNYGKDDEYLLGVLVNGNCFGEMGSLVGKKERITIVAYEDSLIMKIPRESQHRFISLNPENAIDLMKMIVRNSDMISLNASMMVDESKQK